MRHTLPSLAGFALSSSLAGAQTVLYQTSFDDASGWTLEDCWNVDADPVIAEGIAHSAPYSLNLNNPGGGYDDCFVDYATSPVIDLSPVVSGAKLSFWCLWDTEDDCYFDAKHVLVSDAATQAVLLDECMYFDPAICNVWGDWHQHTIDLDPAWGQVQVRFWFDVQDSLFNAFAGWLVDDLEVTGDCLESVPYCAPKVNSQGCTPTIFTTGLPSYTGSGTAFRVQAQNVLNKHPGLMIWSFAAGSTPFGGGTLCLGGSVKRTQGQASGGNPTPPTDCSGAYSFNITPDMMQAENMTPGADVFVQYWSRDQGFSPPDNMGLTAGMQFTVCP